MPLSVWQFDQLSKKDFLELQNNVDGQRSSCFGLHNEEISFGSILKTTWMIFVLQHER